MRAVARSAEVVFLAGPAGSPAAAMLPGVTTTLTFCCPWIDGDPPAVDARAPRPHPGHHASCRRGLPPTSSHHKRRWLSCCARLAFRRSPPSATHPGASSTYPATRERGPRSSVAGGGHRLSQDAAIWRLRAPALAPDRPSGDTRRPPGASAPALDGPPAVVRSGQRLRGRTRRRHRRSERGGAAGSVTGKGAGARRGQELVRFVDLPQQPRSAHWPAHLAAAVDSPGWWYCMHRRCPALVGTLGTSPPVAEYRARGAAAEPCRVNLASPGSRPRRTYRGARRPVYAGTR